MSSPLRPLSVPEAEALFGRCSLAPSAPGWRLQAVGNLRRDPRARQQFILHTDHPVGFLTIGTELEDFLGRVELFAAQYPDLAAPTLGTARQDGQTLLLQAFVPGRPLLEALGDNPAGLTSVLEKLERQFAAKLRPSTPVAATTELRNLGEKLCALPLWTDHDRALIHSALLPWLESRLIPAAPQMRVSNGDFLSQNLLTTADGTVHIIDCENAAVTHFYAEDWLRFGHWSELSPETRRFVNAQTPDLPAWTVYFVFRQLLLEVQTHGGRRFRLDAPGWCAKIKSAVAADGELTAALVDWPEFTAAAPTIGLQLFWKTDFGWSEPASQIIEVSPGAHEVSFAVPPEKIHQLRLDPLDVPGTAIIERLRVTDLGTGGIRADLPGVHAWQQLVPGGDAALAAGADPAFLRITARGNDPQLFLPPFADTCNGPLSVTVKLTVNFALAASGSLNGNVEQISPEALLGWAHDADQPAEPVAIHVHVRHRVIATLLAGAFRSDLRAAGLGDGRKAFFFNPRPHLDREDAEIRLTYARTGELLPNGSGRLRLDGDASAPDWDHSFRLNRAEPPLADRLARFPREQWPLISVVVPVYNTPARHLDSAVRSVLDQAYPKWELCLVDDASTDLSVRAQLQALAGTDARIKLRLEPANRGISAATNAGLALASGEFVALLDHDDELTPDALGEMAVRLLAEPETDVLYSDQEKCDEEGRKFQPFFKPDWSPVYFLGVMYVGHLLVVRTALLRAAGGCDSRFDRVQDYELMLRLGERTGRIGHVPKLLYRWRTLPGSIALSSHAKGPVDELQVAAVQAHLDRRGLPARAITHPRLPHRIHLVPGSVAPPGKISIIIPSKDAPGHLQRCLESIFQRTTHRDFEVLVVDTGTTDAAALAIMAAHPIRRLEQGGAFNFSRANNFAAQAARGDVLVLLNNDTEVVTPDWLQIMLTHLSLPGVGAVGPLLLYPSGTVQHAGVALGLRGTCDHVMRGCDPDDDGHGGALACSREVSALTAACLMVRRDKFLAVGGLEEAYAHIYQDADFCLRLRAGGDSCVFAANVTLRHHEGVSRGSDYDFVDRAVFLDRWGDAIAAGDPYYNPNFTRNRGDYVPR
jgi:glycosyltransferase involved in cell wall biosynthesis